MANGDPQKKQRNDHWRHLVKKGHEIDVSDACKHLIDEEWTSSKPQRSTTRASGTVPYDYELTVRKVVYHILWKGDGRGYGLHSIYDVDDYAIEGDRVTDDVTTDRTPRARRQTRTRKAGRRRIRA